MSELSGLLELTGSRLVATSGHLCSCVVSRL